MQSACLPGVHADSNVHISNALRGGGGGGGYFMPHPLVPGIIQWRRMGILIMRVSSILYLVLVMSIFLLLFRKQLECIGRGRTNKNVLCGHTMLETHIIPLSVIESFPPVRDSISPPCRSKLIRSGVNVPLYSGAAFDACIIMDLDMGLDD